jgi:hypothetical protein
MCPPKPKVAPPPAPPPAAPPPPAETAVGFQSGDKKLTEDGTRKKTGIEALRVDLAIPGGSGNGLNVPI